jgi:hypothetical protein
MFQAGFEPNHPLDFQLFKNVLDDFPKCQRAIQTKKAPLLGGA